jgi:formate hydrogenlyase subunit 3/multisubunit Na+/H+ antiporter MnhD subunit
MNLLLFPLGPFFFLVSLGIVMAVLMPKEKQTACLAWVGALASAFILWTGAAALFQSAPEHIDLWTVSGVGTLSLGLDPLTGLFLIITGLVMLPAAIAAAALLDGTPYPISKRGFVLLYWGLYCSDPVCPRRPHLFPFMGSDVDFLLPAHWPEFQSRRW